METRRLRESTGELPEEEPELPLQPDRIFLSHKEKMQKVLFEDILYKGMRAEEQPDLIPDPRALISFDPDFGFGKYSPAVDTLWFSSSMEIEVLLKRISES